MLNCKITKNTQLKLKNRSIPLLLVFDLRAKISCKQFYVYRLRFSGILPVERIKFRENFRLHNLVFILREKLSKMGNYDALSIQYKMFGTNLQNRVKNNLTWGKIFFSLCPAGIYMFRVSNGKYRTRCEIYSKLRIKTTERSQAWVWCLYS